MSKNKFSEKEIKAFDEMIKGFDDSNLPATGAAFPQYEDLLLMLSRDYRNLKVFDDGRIIGIMPLLFTHAIVSDLDMYGYADRWCYHSYTDAKKALDAWDGTGEPAGWHRHPDTGRRVNEDGTIEVRF